MVLIEYKQYLLLQGGPLTQSKLTPGLLFSSVFTSQHKFLSSLRSNIGTFSSILELSFRNSGIMVTYSEEENVQATQPLTLAHSMAQSSGSLLEIAANPSILSPAPKYPGSELHPGQKECLIFDTCLNEVIIGLPNSWGKNASSADSYIPISHLPNLPNSFHSPNQARADPYPCSFVSKTNL